MTHGTGRRSIDRGRRINITAGNLPPYGSHPTGIEFRSEVHRDWISFDLSRASLASFSGGFELRQRPATAERKARSSCGYQPGAIHSDRAHSASHRRLCTLTSKDVLWCVGSSDGRPVRAGMPTQAVASVDQNGRAQCLPLFTGTAVVLAGKPIKDPSPMNLMRVRR